MVTNFQTRVGIVADGIAGAQTEAKLLSEQTGLDRREAPFAQPPPNLQSPAKALKAVSTPMGIDLDQI